MKILTLIGVMCAAALSFGCASNPSSTEVVTTSDLSYSEQYRRDVRRSAGLKNVDIQWVNPPDDEDLDEHYEGSNGSR